MVMFVVDVLARTISGGLLESSTWAMTRCWHQHRLGWTIERFRVVLAQTAEQDGLRGRCIGGASITEPFYQLLWP